MKWAIVRSALGFAFVMLAVGCHSQPAQNGGSVNGSRVYAAEGTIERISPDRHIVTIHHQAIPGYMMEMTMDFPVHDEHLLDGFSSGDVIDFNLRVDSEEAWVESARRIGQVALPDPNGAVAGQAAPAPMKPGDLLPDAEFTSEEGKTVHLSEFRGKAVAFTFFFTRCPLPNYCPLMNHNFAEARSRLLSDPRAPSNWQFLSISFDPDFDRPETLRSFAEFYRHHQDDRWLFVAATPQTLAGFAAPLGLMVMRQDNNISHNLRTVVIDPQGRLFCQFNDNLWKPEQLADAVERAARKTAANP